MRSREPLVFAFDIQRFFRLRRVIIAMSFHRVLNRQAHILVQEYLHRAASFLAVEDAALFVQPFHRRNRKLPRLSVARSHS